MPSGPIRPRLQKCGLLGETMACLLKEVASGSSLESISRSMAEGSLLSFRSADGRKNVLAALKIRFLQAPRPLPDHTSVARLFDRVTSPVVRNQVLLPYLMSADLATYRVLTRLVLPRLRPGEFLSREDVVEELGRLFAEEGRKPWSPYLQGRWANGVLSVLRDAGALSREASPAAFLDYVVRPEAFCFHLWGLWESGCRGRELVDSNYWRLLLLEAEGARERIRAVAERRWWRINKIGGTEEVLPAFPSIKEWIADGLG